MSPQNSNDALSRALDQLMEQSGIRVKEVWRGQMLREFSYIQTEIASLYDCTGAGPYDCMPPAGSVEA